MQSLYDYKRFAILYVDDEENSLKYFKRNFADKFRILTALDAKSAYRILEENQEDIGILMTDQRMPGEKGVKLLEKARQLCPRSLRMLVTAYSDVDAAVEAVNNGAIYKYISKPWEIPDLEVTLRRAMEFYIVQRERDQLLKEKLAVLHNLMITDRVIGLGIVAAGLGHHIRNALVAVQTFLELAPARLEGERVDMDALRNPDFWQDFYVHVKGQVDRIVGLVGDLREAAEKGHPMFYDHVQLGRVVAEAVEKAKEGFAAKRIVLENHIPDRLPLLMVDSPKFMRLFELLLKDEMNSLPEGSLITLRAKAQPATDDQAAAIVVEVQDNGPGLPQESLRCVFDPFFVRHDDPQEFGLNLMTCYFIVYHHGGQIAISSDKGHGTTFTLTFPTTPPVATHVQDHRNFLSKVLLNESLWEKLLAGR